MTPSIQSFSDLFPHDPTAGQRQFFEAFISFLENDNPRSVLLLKGFAGTGKTTLISTMVKFLPMYRKDYILMAPTGRAAKVMSQYSGKPAYTIHKRIYRQVAGGDGSLQFEVNVNRKEDQIVIVDEASMIHEDRGFKGRGLLSDIFTFLFTASSGNKLVLIGDTAQLPPVGQELSPALDGEYLSRDLHAHVTEVQLTEVMRQALDSGILRNATALREILQRQRAGIQFSTAAFRDIFKMTSERLEDGLRYAYDRYGEENVIIICRSNKAANMYNQYIRRQLHFYENELEAGEVIMVVKNNYLYSPNETRGSFIANGDFAEIMKIISFEEIYGHRFATLLLRLVDYPAEEAFEAKVMLDTLYLETPSLPHEMERKLYEEVQVDYGEMTMTERKMQLRKDPYLNALQIKFAYALTCHKSQGGQWPAVFVEQGYINEENITDDAYVRWLYTAVTRATNELFLVNFHPQFFV